MAGIYILLPVHNRKEVTRGFIYHLKMQTYQDYQLVLIDDGSTDGIAEMVSAEIPSTVVLRGTGSLWWAGSLQRGLIWLKSQNLQHNPLVLMINDDLSFAADYLQKAKQIMAKCQQTLMLSCMLDRNGDFVQSGIHADLIKLTFNTASSADKINCLSTRGLFIHWQDVCKIGDFHPIILPHYLSDYEYTMRAYAKGMSCQTSPDLIIAPNFETTGYHQIEAQNFCSFVSKYFSKKSAANPLYWSSFLLLRMPLWYLPFNLVRICLPAEKTILIAIFRLEK